MVREAVLSKVVVANDLSDLEHQLVALCERVLTDELYDLGEVVFSLRREGRAYLRSPGMQPFGSYLRAEHGAADEAARVAPAESP